VVSELVCFSSGSCVTAEVVSSSPDIERGLSGRESLGEDEGMLFVFASSREWGFWMPDMNFPLDIIWVDVNGSIVHIEPDMQPCGSGECIIYYPDESARYVVEVNAGYALTNNVSVGQLVNSTTITGQPVGTQSTHAILLAAGWNLISLPLA